MKRAFTLLLIAFPIYADEMRYAEYIPEKPGLGMKHGIPAEWIFRVEPDTATIRLAPPQFPFDSMAMHWRIELHSEPKGSSGADRFVSRIQQCNQWAPACTIIRRDACRLKRVADSVKSCLVLRLEEANESGHFWVQTIFIDYEDENGLSAVFVSTLVSMLYDPFERNTDLHLQLTEDTFEPFYVASQAHPETKESGN